MMNWLQSGGLLQVGGLVVLAVCVKHMLNERKAKRIAKLMAEAQANDLSVERTINKHVKSMRNGGGK